MVNETDQDDLVSRLVPFLIQRGYEPGERVPSERELSERFAVSRGQVREALAYLEALRLVERRAKSGIFMSNLRPSLEALAMFASVGVELNAEDVRQSVEMRRVFEVSAVKLAAARATEANFERLDAIMQATADRIAAGEGIAHEDVDFHLEIVNATQNEIFLRLVGVFYRMSEKRRVIYFRDPARSKASYAEHADILAALRRRDAPAAEQLMERHLQGVDSYWRGLMSHAPTSESEDHG
jgi:GntR family transcriptional regulator, transcriptional repressor for pyruvate dehydrogenase complex